MKYRMGKRFLSLLLALVMVILMLPVTSLTALATDEMRSEIKWGKHGRIQFVLDDSGVLTWSAVSGATGYDINIYMHGSLFQSEEGNTSRSYNLVSKLNQYKKDSGTVTINLLPKGVAAGNADQVSFTYSSPYPKLEVPSNLKWDVYGNADWNDVANADGYTLYLYQPSGGAYNHYDLATSYFNCTNYPDVATRVSDGWFFAVRATSTGNYRSSEYNESYNRGYVPGGGLVEETKWSDGGKVKFTVTSDGVLTWSPINGAKSYDLNMWMDDGLFRAVTGLTSCKYDLEAELNKARKNSGTVKISLSPIGTNVAGQGGTVYFLYSSPYGKLEAPTHLTWNGNIASWGYVPGAESYTVYLYQPSGSAYNHWTTNEPQFDFSTVANPSEGWYFTVKATSGTSRDSAFAESPRYTGPVSTTLYTIGVYTYDATLDTFDSGGQVKLTTVVGTENWSVSGYTLDTLKGTAVTVEATPVPGYVFVEWRQGTKGTTISKDATYSFTVTNNKYLYAIFRQKGANEIAEVVGKIADENIPHAGMELEHFIPTIPDGEPYSRIWNGSEWRDENGALIAPSVEQHYGRGYEFEAGRSYTTDYFYFEAADGYTFAEDVKVHLQGPDASMWEYEITGFNNTRTILYVQFTFHVPGNRDYPDINKVSLVYSGTPADGSKKPDPSELIYNNCALTREEWNAGGWGDEPVWGTNAQDDSGALCFVAGNTYVHMIQLTAFPGYHFSENLLVQKGRQGYEEYGVVSLSDDRTVATITYTYNISDYIEINRISLLAKTGDEDFCLIRGGHNMASGVPFESGGDQYEVLNRFQWYNAETGQEVASISTADVKLGEKYEIVFRVDLKDEYLATHRYAENPTIVLGGGYQYERADFVEVTSCGGGTYREVHITFTVQPKPGEGNSANYPVVCSAYSEFKYAMENEDVRYVALGNVNETMPVGPEGLVTAIKVSGIKNLTLLGDATFTAPAMTATTYAALLHTTQNTTLNISGTGSVTFKAVANNSFNAVIYNQGGSVNISEGYIQGAYNTAVYGKAIWQEYGELRVSGGNLIGTNALAPLSLPRATTAVTIQGGKAWIEGGTFKMINMINTTDLPYGLEIGQSATVDLSGGTFYGIKLPTDSTPLANYMDEDLYTPLTNESKFNPASVYSQQYTASGKIVRIAWLVDHVDVYVNAPMAGVDITENYFNIPTSGCQAAMYYPQWYKNGQLITYGTFEAGASYKVVVQIEVKPGYNAEFTKGVTAAFNRQSVAVERMSAHWIEVEYDFGECPTVISLVELTATAPKEGQKPSYTIGLGSNAYKLVGNYNNYKDYRQWYMSSDGDEWWPINENHTFMAGYYYKLYVDIQTASGYEFPLIDNGTIQPDVSATVNGYYARVIKAYDQDPSTYITVEYNFGMCNDSVVEQITVVDVTAPVAGERPNYIYNILGSGYQMNTAKNAYYDAYWLNPAEKWYYIKNGIGWFDMTESNWVYEHETFIAGHEYRAYFYLINAEGYEFAYTTKYYENAVTATVNGNTADVQIWDGYFANQRRVGYTFTCQQKEVSTVMLLDLNAPQANQMPDRTVTTDRPDLYTVEHVNWYDSQGNLLYGDEPFRTGEQYKVEIKIVPVKANGVTACQFASPVSAFINGEQVTQRLDWDTVYGSSNAVYVQYTFIKSASAPATGAYVSGSVTSFNDAAADVTLQFIPQGGSVVAYETTVTGNTANYFFTDVAAGTYTLKVTKAKHVTRAYTVTVVGSSVVQDVKICLVGDVTGDGRVNVGDVSKLYAHIRGTALLTDDYQLLCANVNGGSLNVGDVSAIYAHVKGTKVLY